MEIREETRTCQEFDAESSGIHQLVEATCVLRPSDPSSKVHYYFKVHPNAEGVVILEGDGACGLVMRNDFYQKMGALYGRDLFMNRPVKLVMNPFPLVMEASVDIATISMIAMNREAQQLYDLVIINQCGKYLGVVSVKRFMVELTRHRERQIELLKEQQEILRRANEVEVEHRLQIEEKNAELADRNESIKNLLDNAGQGFLSFGEDRKVSGEHSLECVQLFREPVSGRDILELLGKHLDKAVLETTAKVVSRVFDPRMAPQRKVYLSLLPEEIRLHDRAVRLEHRMIAHRGQPRVMLVLTDVTEQKRLERTMRRERKNLRLVVKAMSRRADLLVILEEFRHFAGEDCQAILNSMEPKAALEEIFRQVHTYKGDFGLMGLHNTSEALHTVENGLQTLADGGEVPESARLEKVLEGLDADAILQEDLSIVAGALGEDFFEREDSFSVSRDSLLDLEHRISALPETPERASLLGAVQSWRMEDFRDILGEFPPYVALLASKLGRVVSPMDVKGDRISVDRRPYTRFVRSLSHVFRNMLDHGLESPEERISSGKEEAGNVTCRVERAGDELMRLTIADDGRGIDADKVLAKATSRGLLSGVEIGRLSRRDILEFIFKDSLSTREEVSALSGRGVGLAAVRAEAHRLGGAVTVESESGRGASFVFTLPIILQ